MPSPRNKHQQAFEVKTSLGYKIINSDDIIFLEAKGKFTIIHFDNHSKLITYHLLKWYTKYLIEPYFLRCHKSYTINCSFINHYTNKEIVMIEGSKVPLSSNRAYSFKEKLKQFTLLKV